MFFFNWLGFGQVAGAVLVGGLLGGLLVVIGLDLVIALALALITAGSFLLWKDFLVGRRSNAPYSAIWRLFVPGAGGHVWFIPCWAIGAASVLVGWYVVIEFVTGMPALDSPALILGLVGFVGPIVSEILLWYGFPRRGSWHEREGKADFWSAGDRSSDD